MDGGEWVGSALFGAGFGGAPLGLEGGQHLGAFEVSAAAQLVVGEQAAVLPLVDGLRADAEQVGGFGHGEQVRGASVSTTGVGRWAVSWRMMARTSPSNWA